MDHVAIMKKSWGLLPKIKTGQKTIESRWYQNKHLPWDKITIGDTVYFKDSGSLITIKAIVQKVLQFANLTPQKVTEIIYQYGPQDGLAVKDYPQYIDLFKNKNYCLLIFLQNPQEINPFDIDKTGFGAMSAWITVNDIDRIKK